MAGGQWFHELGYALEGDWRRAGYDERCFSPLATETLAKLSSADCPRPGDIINWALSPGVLPPQLSLNGDFGQPPITVFRAGRFVIDVYFWVEGTTAIHQHGFSGAFRVLSGSSVHGQYGFQIEERISARFQLGRVQARSLELLKEGDVREIQSGNRFIHSLFHLDKPSVSLVVRTIGEPESGPQLNYYQPHVAIAPLHVTAETTMVLRVLELLVRTQDPSLERRMADVISSSDIHTAYLVLLKCHELQLPLGLVRRIAATGHSVHGERLASLEPVFVELAREKRLLAVRAQTSAVDHRFLLALFMNVRRAADLRSLVAAYGAPDPAGRVAQWLEELSGHRPHPALREGGPPLQLPPLAIAALRRRLERTGESVDPETSRALLGDPILAPYVH